jgi:hypothetical protein
MAAAAACFSCAVASPSSALVALVAASVNSADVALHLQAMLVEETSVLRVSPVSPARGGPNRHSRPQSLLH